MARMLRLLLIEDSEDDALLLVEALRHGGHDPDFTRVDTPQTLEAALENDDWDAIIADYNLPSFTGLDALRIVQAKRLDVPLILVSGAIGEEQAVEALKAGFHDFIIKGNFSRLAQALARELRETQVRREREEAVEGLHRAHVELEQRVAARTAELQAVNTTLRNARMATLNLMEDTIIARREAEETSERLRLEILERKHAEEALRRSEEQLEAINVNLEREVEQRTRELQETQKQFLHAEKLSAIGKLSASIAHEFNNPLQGIMSILQGVRKRAVMDEEDRELLEAALEESDRMKDLIRSLQDFNRPSSHKKVFLDVHHSLESILLLHKSDFNKKRIAVVRNYEKGLPQIQAVPDQIKQVILNLLTNAADACPGHGGEITVSTWQEDDRIAMAIKDTGVGIKPADMEHIFRPFYSTKPEVKGTGLGLSVSYGIVKNHQGEIRVDSRPGEGATFTVLLPIQGGDDIASATEK